MQRKPMLILAVVALFLFASTPAWAGEAEATFIRSLYTSLGVNFDSQADACTYTGVTCPTGNTGLYEIDLSERNLNAAQLPDVNADDLMISKIDLDGNRGIRGRLPNSWGRLSYLEELDLSGCSLTGSIPDSWNANLRRLREIDLSNNALCNGMPNWNYNTFPELREVNFGMNYLQYFSSAFGTFSASPNFQRLSLMQNDFCQCMPDTWTSQALIDGARTARGDADSATCNTNCRGSTCRSTPRNGAATLSTVCVSVLSVVLAVLVVMM